MEQYRPMNSKPKIIAFYLPQFHPITENNKWWGSGFTEWHNVAKARPLFLGHDQPKLPGELGFYDLRLAETRDAQAALAQEYGVYGFCYWHYWFGGKRLLEQPLEQVIALGQPKLPFCVGWANESWTGVWHGSPSKVLIEQTYPEYDAIKHYAVLRRFFKDDRYIKIYGKPLLYLYKPRNIPLANAYLKSLRMLAKEDSFPDLYIVGTWSPNPGGRFESTSDLGLDAGAILNITGRHHSGKSVHTFSAIQQRLFGRISNAVGPKRYRYSDAVKNMLPNLADFEFDAYNTVISNWDNTPRSGRRGFVLSEGGAEEFGNALKRAITNTISMYRNEPEKQIVFLKSWNEWAEGNYIEPDQVNGRSYLVAVKKAIQEHSDSRESE